MESGGGQTLVTVEFKVTPENAKVTLYDRDKQIVEPRGVNVYKVAPRNILI